MIRTRRWFLGSLLVPAAAALAGCSQGTKGGHDHDHDHDHEHEALGPHGGHLIELGEDAFHAELTHNDEKHRVAIYLLDGAAKAMPAAESLPAEVKLTFDDKGKTVDYTLAKVADGKYEITNDALCSLLSGNFDVKCSLAATIAGKSYTGALEHEAHEHDHNHHHHDHGDAKKK
ncbi:MAG: hypothetical protein JSS27_19820 [Planctomycetes bacterium]|nr:hypothetical protein [Planctomycetota bacterium]